MRFITVGRRLLGVILIGVLVFAGTGLVRAVPAGGAGHEHTVFSARLPNVPGKTSRLLWSSTAPEAAQHPTFMPGECLRLCTFRTDSLGEFRDRASAGLSPRGDVL